MPDMGQEQLKTYVGEMVEAKGKVFEPLPTSQQKNQIKQHADFRTGFVQRAPESVFHQVTILVEYRATLMSMRRDGGQTRHQADQEKCSAENLDGRRRREP
jgi:hypothetical protein